MAKKKLKKMSIERAIELIERDHGGCDQHTCTLSMALENGYFLVAIDNWIGSGAASSDFDNVSLPYSHGEVRAESKRMSKELEHVSCPHCNSVLWLPEECGYLCDDCGKDTLHGPKPSRGAKSGQPGEAVDAFLASKTAEERRASFRVIVGGAA